jgi:hypothetical protein
MMKPEGVRITNHMELKREIMRLNQIRAAQEDTLKQNFKEIYYSLHPVEIIKRAADRIKDGSESKGSLVGGIAKMGLGIGASFLFKKLLMKSGGALMSLVVEKVSSAMSKKSESPLTKGLAKLTSLFKKKSKWREAFD